MAQEPKVRAVADQIIEVMPDWVNTMIHLNGLIADRMSVVPTDFQCLHAIVQNGPTTAGAVAQRVALTPGSVSRSIDRLEAADCVRRVPDPGDRRRALLEATPEGLQKISGYYEGLTKRTRDDLNAFSGDELKSILRFVSASRVSAEAAVQDLRGE
ncbi:MarR family winged helix-turn-helix transcriptional regulator [Promicromonospora panici]|uniref:MarR family winged helix-turn-helix transcriptional regulator n=1 Tax=Promicromonospora panici TaxID=2219658 RepID=UPI00101D5E3E|nr:MarR family transcriptional regulator [Promicromonospora panici]